MGLRTRVAARSTLLLVCVLACACAAPPDQSPRTAANTSPAPPPAGSAPQGCPERAGAPALLPGTRKEHRQLAYWLERQRADALDRPLMTSADIARYNESTGRRPGPHPFAQRKLLPAGDPNLLAHEVSERLGYMRERVESGEYVDAQAAPLSEEQRAPFEATADVVAAHTHVTLAAAPIYCGPLAAPLFKRDQPPVYDRNACSTARPQEALQVLSRWPGGLLLVQTRYALGWVRDDLALSPALDAEQAARVEGGPRVRALDDVEVIASDGTRHRLRKHATLPLDANGVAWVADEAGLHALAAGHPLQPTQRDLTRRALLETAFNFLDSRYGFGGSGGGRDCSRLLLDIFETFDVALPRHSGWQAKAGSFHIDVSQRSEAEKLQLIDRAAERGALLLHFPGHIMLYLGRDAEGRPMALHALGEYARPCSGGGETVVDVQRTVVSDLELGRGSSRGAFIERLTTLVVLGAEPGPQLEALAKRPAEAPPAAPPEACGDDADARIFVSPRHPVAGEPLRFIATSARPLEGASLWVFGPDGARLTTTPRALGGPPFTTWTRVDAPEAGRHTAVWMRGDEVVACKRTGVRRHDTKPQAERAEGAVWDSRWSWEQDTDNLWSAFVEQLFDYPVDDGRTWTNLHDLLRDRERNLLHDHLGAGEDRQLELVPDCADLPYVLRGYFAWKLKLPFAYRQCSRGRPGRPPSCGPLRTNMMPREANGDLAAFAHFINRKVRRGVHSASGRTVPDDSLTDLYPVALERASLPPGTVYADPYGHVMMLTRWLDQGRPGADYGLLMAAEAQPDGTVGRRRFFRGSFLFDPDTSEVGAGFKQFRPLALDAEKGAIVSLDNETLAGQTQHAPYSRMQYEGSKDAFYERMDALINPLPLDPHARLVSLVDAFEESVRRRVIAVSNGETFMAEHGYRTVEMPVGHDVFETEGPWEDYSTPSRDMRLLISLDTVTGFPDLVARYPERFKLADAAAGKAAARRLGAELEQLLSSRAIEYVRSDGSTQALSLQALRERADALELAYNPNDCVEVRWGAPEGTEERASCKRSAPAEQRARMLRYRPWFHERTRPARGARAP